MATRPEQVWVTQESQCRVCGARQVSVMPILVQWGKAEVVAGSLALDVVADTAVLFEHECGNCGNMTCGPYEPPEWEQG